MQAHSAEWGGTKNRTGLLTHDRLMRQKEEGGREMDGERCVQRTEATPNA